MTSPTQSLYQALGATLQEAGASTESIAAVVDALSPLQPAIVSA